MERNAAAVRAEASAANAAREVSVGASTSEADHSAALAERPSALVEAGPKNTPPPGSERC